MIGLRLVRARAPLPPLRVVGFLFAVAFLLLQLASSAYACPVGAGKALGRAEGPRCAGQAHECRPCTSGRSSRTAGRTHMGTF